ncbi:MAG: TadE/TadG family type IV pilus assembly protein, partial [Actinomycetota bacterium]
MRARRRDDRGATLVEFALVLPLLALLAFGTVEFGLAWRDSMTISNSLRSGARGGSNSSDDRMADFNILKQVESAIREIDNTRIERVVIFKSTDPDGVAPSACVAGTAVSGVCNVYTATQMENLTASDFDSPTCTNDPDTHWCPTSREDRQVVGADYLGVWVQIHRDWVTGLFPPSTGLTMTDSAVMRL